MITKFLKTDGTIDEGEPLTEQQAVLREALGSYLHAVICKSSYHPTYEGLPKCQSAANYLTIIFTTIDVEEFGDCIAEHVKKLNTPKPAVRAKQPEDDGLTVMPSPSSVDDDLPL